MKRNIRLATLAVLVPLLTVVLLVSDVVAQTQIYIPNILTKPENVEMPPIGIQTCSDWNNDGVDENLYIKTKEVFPNGTPLPEIRKKYRMLPGDFGAANNKFFPGGTINTYIAEGSAVCVPIKYKVAFVDVTGNEETDPIMKFEDSVPGWENNFWNSPEVQSAALMTDTFTVVMGFVAVDSLWGAEVVGSLTRGGQTWGKIIKGIPGSVAVQFMNRAVSGFVLLDALYNRISTATALGVVYSATVLSDDGAGVFYGTQEIPWAYFACREDGTDLYENLMAQSNAVRMYTTGNGKQACVISRIEIPGSIAGSMGTLLYKMEVLNAVALRIVAEEVEEREHTGPTTLIKESEVKEIADLIIQWWETHDDDDGNDPIIPAPDPDGECLRLSDESYHVQEAINNTKVELEMMLRDVPADEVPQYNRLLDFVNWAKFDFAEMELEDRYASPRPRNGFHMAHLTSAPLNQGAQYQGTVEVFCFGTGTRYIWVLDNKQGRLRTGLTSTIWPVGDYVPPYRYKYEDFN